MSAIKLGGMNEVQITRHFWLVWFTPLLTKLSLDADDRKSLLMLLSPTLAARTWRTIQSMLMSRPISANLSAIHGSHLYFKSVLIHRKICIQQQNSTHAHIDMTANYFLFSLWTSKGILNFEECLNLKGEHNYCPVMRFIDNTLGGLRL